MKKYDYLVFIGRFQPFHNGHKAVIDHARTLANHVIVLVGSTEGPRSPRNPFTFDERDQMIMGEYFDDSVVVAPIKDFTYNDQAWIEGVQEVVYDNMALTDIHGNTGTFTPVGFNDADIGLIGHSKDHTSYYLNLFPQWGSEDVPAYDDRHMLSATQVRNRYFNQSCKDGSPMPYDRLVPVSTLEVLQNMAEFDRETYDGIVDELDFLGDYAGEWGNGPFNTADAVVVQSGHVLLIRRGDHPGRGLYALPGGFLNNNETIADATIRELREETRLKVPAPVLKGSIVTRSIYDDPYRDPRARIITVATLFNLAPWPELPKVQGGDDAASAHWVQLSMLDPKEFFGDHYHIIQNLVREI